jgi:hypothetical protein
MDQLKGSIAGMNHNIEEAKGALKESLFAKSYYIREGKLLVAGKWDTIALASQAVLARYSSTTPKERRRVQSWSR